MEFEFFISAKRCLVMNPHGSLAICTLWTPPEFIEERLKQAGVNFSSQASPVAIIGGLFGGGLKAMLRNLLYNPQIDTVVIFGKDMSESGVHLASFFENGEKPTGKSCEYTFEDGTIHELEQVQIVGNEVNYVMDDLIRLDMFKQKTKVVKLSTAGVSDISPLVEFINTYSEQIVDNPNRILERVAVPMPEMVVDSFPSDVRSHTIVGDSIVGAWKQLLVRLSKFGVATRFRSGKERNELHNVKVVVNSPRNFTNDELSKHGISPEIVSRYQKDLINPSPPIDGTPYSYGNRLGYYFAGEKTPLEYVIEDLSELGDSRHSYITLWDNNVDICGESSPCFVSVFFRKIDTVLHLTATFRSHNATNAWPKNALGLLGVLEYVCSAINMGAGQDSEMIPGTISIISHSISIDKSDLPNVQGYIDDELQHSKTINMDPNGYLQIAISPEDSEIVVQHFNHNNEFLKEYRGRKPQEVQNQLYRNCVLSDIGHAMYIGGQLERAYICLHNDIEYRQDKTILIRE